MRGGCRGLLCLAVMLVLLLGCDPRGRRGGRDEPGQTGDAAVDDVTAVPDAEMPDSGAVDADIPDEMPDAGTDGGTGVDPTPGVPGGSGLSVTAGGGLGSSPRYRLGLSIGGTRPRGTGSSNRFQLSLAAPAAQ